MLSGHWSGRRWGDRRITGLAAWMAVGAVTGFAVLSMFSIGIFLVPLVAVLIALVARRFGDRVAWLGAISGCGISVITVGLLNLSYRPCGQGSLPAGVACGGLSPAPWLIGGSVVTAAPLVLSAVLATVGHMRADGGAPGTSRSRHGAAR